MKTAKGLVSAAGDVVIEDEKIKFWVKEVSSTTCELHAAPCAYGQMVTSAQADDELPLRCGRVSIVGSPLSQHAWPNTSSGR